MENRKAIVFGGTGLVGRAVIDELGKSDNYKAVKVFSRSEGTYPETAKIKNYLVDFEHPESFAEHITGDDLFICLGTTIRKAGTVSRMEQIDRDLPVALAKYAAENRVARIAVISSIGADKNSSSYYLRIKGEMEQGILDLDFATILIARPSLLLGKRDERRLGEQTGKALMKVFRIFLAGKYKKYRGIESRDVAKAMISILEKATGKAIYESDRLQMVADLK